MRRPPFVVVVTAIPVVLVVLCAIAGPWIVPGAMDKDILTGVTAPGHPGQLFGTDQLGRDIGAMAVAGARSAIVGPVVIALGSMALGVLLGSWAGFRGGWLDLVITKYADLLLSLPTILIAIVVAGVIDGGYWATVVVLTVLFSPIDIRMARGAAQVQSTQPYIDAARTLGLPTRRILYRHVLPNIAPVAVATMLTNIAYALTSISALSFLGVGVQPGQADWGRQISDGKDLLGSNSAAAVLPGVLVIVTATSINLLGDWLTERAEARGGVR